MILARWSVLCLVALMAGAGGCGSDDSDADAGVPDGARRTIPDDVLARHAIGYSGYRGTQSPDAQSYPSEEEIKADLDLLVRGQWTLIRLWDCSTHAERVLKVIKDNGLDIKVLLGVWIAGAKATHDQENREQIDRCVTLSHDYDKLVVAVSVGNETLDSWSDVLVTPGELAAYITDVRARVAQPVTTDDFTVPFTLGIEDRHNYADVIEVAKAVDFLSLHVYPFLDAPYDSWDWKQLEVAEGPERAVAMMDEAMKYVKRAISDVATVMQQEGLERPIVIGETGWKSAPTGAAGDPSEAYRAHPVNQKMYYDRVQSWVYGDGRDEKSPKTVFYFEAFDEPWKAEDDGWGLFDTDRNAKYVLWDAFPDRKPAGAPSYSAADAVYDREPINDLGVTGD
jgi:exo-beta-1,3-glucanase (GH17 family)